MDETLFNGGKHVKSMAGEQGKAGATLQNNLWTRFLTSQHTRGKRAESKARA